MNKFYIVVCCTLLLFCASCKRISEYNVLRKIIGQQITMPANIHFIAGTNPFYANSDSASATIFFWVDSTQCGTCRLTSMNPYYNVFDFCRDSVDNVNVVILFTPSKEKRDVVMDVAMYRDRDVPIYVDEMNDFYELNKFIPKDVIYHSFLLNEHNEIILAGDPLSGTAIWNLYRNVLFSINGDATE